MDMAARVLEALAPRYAANLQIDLQCRLGCGKKGKAVCDSGEAVGLGLGFGTAANPALLARPSTSFLPAIDNEQRIGPISSGDENKVKLSDNIQHWLLDLPYQPPSNQAVTRFFRRISKPVNESMLTIPRLAALQSSASSSVWSDDDVDSMASTNATDAIPPLTRGNSIVSSECSAQTDQASSIIGEGFVLESHEGVLMLPDRYQMDADLLCPFQILDCEKVFADIVHFKMHVFSHFKGHTLPPMASCFLCDNKYSQRSEDDPALAWNNMLSHMVHDHYRRGQQLATVRADFMLMRWMYSRRLINEHQFKRTQLVPIPTLLPGRNGRADEIVNTPQAPAPPATASPHAILARMTLSVGLNNEPYTMTAGRRAERRQRDATRHLIRTRSLM